MQLKQLLRPVPKMLTGLPAALLAAAGLRFVLSYFERVPFNGDEAVVGLMARHILQGERPVFFYGQAYMGSLGAWLTAGMFALAGESVAAIRWVQILIFLLFLTAAWGAAYQLFQDTRPANLTSWMLACGPVNLILYTTATLGGYGELLALGTLVLWLVLRITNIKERSSPGWWLVLGLAGGLAFWVHALAVVYLLPATLLLVVASRLWTWKQILAAGAAFLAGSSPWWVYNFQHDFSALHALSGVQYGATTLAQRLVGLLLLGLPAVAGLRFPWSAEMAPLPVLATGILLHLLLGLYLLSRALARQRLALESPTGRGIVLLGGVGLSFVILFLGSRFGVDATGRYLLPLHLPVAVAFSAMLSAAWRRRPKAAAALFLLVISFYGLQVWRAAALSDGLTTQFDPLTRFDNSHDDALIDFLRAEDEKLGYTNYWVAYRIAFLSQEEIIYAPMLPYKLDLSYAPTDLRYPAYRQQVAEGSKNALILTYNPPFQLKLEETLASLAVGYSLRTIGPYRVYYSLSRPVFPWQLGVGGER